MPLLVFPHVIEGTRLLTLSLLELDLELMHHLEQFLDFIQVFLRLGRVCKHFVVSQEGTLKQLAN